MDSGRATVDIIPRPTTVEQAASEGARWAGLWVSDRNVAERHSGPSQVQPGQPPSSHPCQHLPSACRLAPSQHIMESGG